VDTVAKVLAEASDWTRSGGRGRAFSDTVAAAITRKAADELNLSPNAFRRLVEPFADGWKIFLFDDNEGGSGNCKRLWELMGEWSDFAQTLRAAAHCLIEDADMAVARALASGRSPESLSVLRNEGRLAEVVRFDGDAASLLRLDRTFENAEIAAFNLYAFAELSELQRQYGGTPPLRRFVQQIVNTFALDPKAEFLRRQFIDSKIGGISELPSRLRAVMPFCEGSCPYCLGEIGDEDYSDRRLVESL
jgi:hypothetical protein